MPIDQVGRKIGESDVKLPVDNPAISEALKKATPQDIRKILEAHGIPGVNIDEFFAVQGHKFQMLCDPPQICALEGAVAPPPPSAFYEHRPSAVMSPEDLQIASDMIIKSVEGKGKSMTKGFVKGQTATAADYQESKNRQTEARTSLDDLNDVILNSQFTRELQTKNDDLMREYNKIVTLLREGKIDPVFGWVALATVNVGRNGTIFAQLGRKMMDLNEKSAKVTDMLKNSPNFEKDVLAAQQQLKEYNQTTTFITNDMQSVSTNVTTNINSLDSFVKQWFSHVAELNRKFNPPGSAG